MYTLGSYGIGHHNKENYTAQDTVDAIRRIAKAPSKVPAKYIKSVLGALADGLCVMACPSARITEHLSLHMPLDVVFSPYAISRRSGHDVWRVEHIGKVFYLGVPTDNFVTNFYSTFLLQESTAQGWVTHVYEGYASAIVAMANYCRDIVGATLGRSALLTTTADVLGLGDIWATNADVLGLGDK